MEEGKTGRGTFPLHPRARTQGKGELPLRWRGNRQAEARRFHRSADAYLLTFTEKVSVALPPGATVLAALPHDTELAVAV